MKLVNNNKAPKISKITKAFNMNFVSLIIPPTLSTASASCRVALWLKLIFCPEIMVIIDATRIIPMPPSCININIINCPKKDQCVAVSTTTRPVTHIADVDVKRQVKKSVEFPDLLANGIISNMAPSKMVKVNPPMIACVVAIL